LLSSSFNDDDEEDEDDTAAASVASVEDNEDEVDSIPVSYITYYLKAASFAPPRLERLDVIGRQRLTRQLFYISVCVDCIGTSPNLSSIVRSSTSSTSLT
jgi:hypothetical protein